MQTLQGGANGSITNGFTVDWSSNGTWNTNNGGADGDDKLMNGYIDAIGGDGAAQVKINGISGAFADGYDLYVYFGSDGNNRTGKIALEEAQLTHLIHFLSRLETSQPSTQKPQTRVTEILNLTTRFTKD